MLPVHRSNIPLANEALKCLLNNSDLNIICIDDFGHDSDYVNDDRIKFIHNTNTTERQPLVKIWNQCIKECPTDNVIITSWRQRPTNEHFNIINEKLNDRFGMVTFDGLHFFGFNKHLLSKIGFFDEGFTRGQYEDTDWFNRIATANIAMYAGDVSEQRIINGQYVNSTWLDGVEENRTYYQSKWVEDVPNNRLIQNKEEVNYSDREIFKDLPSINYREFKDSILTPNLNNYYHNLFFNYVKNF